MAASVRGGLGAVRSLHGPPVEQEALGPDTFRSSEQHRKTGSRGTSLFSIEEPGLGKGVLCPRERR